MFRKSGNLGFFYMPKENPSLRVFGWGATHFELLANGIGETKLENELVHF